MSRRPYLPRRNHLTADAGTPRRRRRKTRFTAVPAVRHREMPRKSSKVRGAAAPRPHLKAGPPNRSPAAAVAEAEGLQVPGDGASAGAEALELLHIDPASDGDPPPPPPSEAEPEPEALAPSQAPPEEASSSGRSAAGGSLDEEAVRKLHELAEAGGEEVALTEEEVHANDQRQEDEVMRCSLILSLCVHSLLGWH